MLSFKMVYIGSSSSRFTKYKIYNIDRSSYGEYYRLSDDIGDKSWLPSALFKNFADAREEKLNQLGIR